MCSRRISATQLLAALAVAGLRPPVFPPHRTEGDAAEPACLICLAEGLQDAADVVEGLIERDVMPGSPAPDH